MKIQITFEPYELSNELSQMAINVLGDKKPYPQGGFVHSFENYILKAFDQALELTALLHNNNFVFNEHTITIFNDFYRDEPTQLAAFSLTQTEMTEKNSFNCSVKMAFQEFTHFIKNGKASGKLTHVFVHELMHLIDWQYLKEFSDAKQFSLNRMLGATGDIPYYLQESIKSPEWTLLEALNELRNEGIAELGARLLYPVDDFHTDIDTAASLLQEIVARYLKSIASRADVKTIRAGIEPLHKALDGIKYHAGPCFVIDALSGDGLKHNDILSALRGDREVAHQIIIDFLKKAVSMDVGDYLRAIINPESEHPWNVIFHHEDILKLFYFISIPNENDFPHAHFIPELYGHAKRHDVDAFIKLLNVVIGSAMDDQEIESYYTEYQRNPGYGDLSERIKDLMERAFSLYKKKPTPLLQAILTYALDPEDIIHDKFPYSGWLDDCYVLEFGLSLTD